MRYFLLVLFYLTAHYARSQNSEIIVLGKVKQAITGKGIVAKVVYKSYPTGNLSETFNDSVFTFSIFGSAKYFVTAEAPDHVKGGILIEPEDAENKRINIEIELTPTGQTIRLNHLIFDAGKDVIKPTSFNELDGLVAMMKVDPKMEIQLEGHTDNVGNRERNMELSQKRVTAVKKYLSSNGISKSRIQTKAFGGTKTNCERQL